MIKRLSIILCLSLLTFSCSKDDSNSVIPPVIEKPDPSIPDKPFYDPNNYIAINKDEIEYYKDVNFSLRGTELKQDLHNLLAKTHRHLNYTPDLWEASKITDEDPDNTNNVILIYGWPKGTSKEDRHMYSIDKNRRNTSGTNISNVRDKLWEREHVFAKSLAQPKLVTYSNDYNYTAKGIIAGTDAHNLRPINGEWNNIRSNHKFAEGKGNSHKVGNYNWYPGDEWKGDVARMMMYMFIRYGDQCKPEYVGIGTRTFFGKNGKEEDGMINLFLKWNAEDPVSPIERKRNDYHGNKNNQYAQGNRNPFIDNPYLANLIWENNNGKIELSENKWAKK